MSKTYMLILLLIFQCMVLGGCGSKGESGQGEAVSHRGSNRQDAGGTPAKEPGTSSGQSWGDAPDLVLKDINGGDFRLSSLRGKVIILDFWATWCAPCRDEIPGFIELYNENKGKGFVVVGVTLDTGGSEVVKGFVEKWGIHYPIVFADKNTTKDYGGIMGLPTSFIIDRKGNIREKHIGYADKSAFEEKIKALLAE